MAGKLGKFVATLVELFNREIKVAGNDDIYQNDIDNLYPNRVELVERNSVTALSASNKLKSFIVGKGFANKEFNEMIVNPKKDIKGYQFLNMVAHSLKTQRGVFIHVNYDIDGNTNYLDVLPYKKCRVSKEDDKGNEGRVFYKNWEKTEKFNAKKTDCKWFYPFNSDNEVILSQRERDARENKKSDFTIEDLVTDYRGQVFFLKLDYNEVYPFAWVDPVYNDADSEFRIALYRNGNLRNGFLDKTMIIPNGIDVESQEGFANDVKNWLGAENSSTVFLFTPDSQIDDPSKIIHTISLKGNYDSKRFELDEKAIANNIRKAYLSIPRLLIEAEDGVFSSSGEAFVQAIEYYNKETLFIREAIAYMMDKFYDGDFTIAELGSEDLQPVVEGEETPKPKSEVSPETLAAQAALKGSVGGVQGILAIQASYSSQLTTLESAVTILTEIFGFTRDIALSLLGNPIIEEGGTSE